MKKDADVAVVGLGAFGSNALWRIAARGIKVLGFERYEIAHNQGSSHGSTRLFRMAVVEHPGLVPLARSSIEMFRKLEQENHMSLLTLGGGIMMGDPDGSLITGIMQVVGASSLDHEVLSAAQVIDRYPQHRTLPDDFVGIFDPMSGVLRPEAVIKAACRSAVLAAAEVFNRTSVLSISPDVTGVTIETALRTFRVDQVVVTTGPWLKVLAPGLHVEANRVPMLWYPPRRDVEASEFDLAQFPVFQREVAGGHRLWGHGRIDGMDVKVGPVGDPTRDRRTDPDDVDRGTTPEDWRYVSSLTATELPGLDQVPSRVLPCMTTMTDDEQYVIGRLGSSRVLVGGAGNAHGFKHCSGIGEVLASQVAGEDVPFDTDFVDPNRYAATLTSTGADQN